MKQASAQIGFVYFKKICTITSCNLFHSVFNIENLTIKLLKHETGKSRKFYDKKNEK